MIKTQKVITYIEGTQIRIIGNPNNLKDTSANMLLMPNEWTALLEKICFDLEIIRFLSF